MTAQTVITHAHRQVVSLRKHGDPALPARRLYLPGGTTSGDLITVNLSKVYPICDGCAPSGTEISRPLYRSTDSGGWVTVMCPTHAYQWGVWL